MSEVRMFYGRRGKRETDEEKEITYMNLTTLFEKTKKKEIPVATWVSWILNPLESKKGNLYTMGNYIDKENLFENQVSVPISGKVLERVQNKVEDMMEKKELKERDRVVLVFHPEQSKKGNTFFDVDIHRVNGKKR